MLHQKDGASRYRQREVAFKADFASEDGRFRGYASVFDVVDSYREKVARGAFAESLQRIKDSGRPLPALWHHRASEPIGGYDVLSEDERGLYCEGFLLHEDVPQARVALATLRRGIVTGLSIGYYVQGDQWDDKAKVLTLTKVDLQEISLVTFPANTEARVEAIRAKLAHGVLPTIREFEAILREQGFSRTQAVEIATRGFKSLLDRGELGSGLSELVAAARGVTIHPL